MNHRKPNYFFTSDTHLSHHRIIGYSNRPFKTVEQMDKAIIERWNTVIRPEDQIYHLGDVAFEKDEKKLRHLLSQLNGHKHLVWGNHDKELHKGQKWKQFFESASDIKHLYVPLDDGSEQLFVLCHYAMRIWNKSHYGAIHLYGHSHGTLPDDPTARSCDVGVDCWNFTPVSVPEILAKMSLKIWTPIDHHQQNG
jgi:calcineurin-like phosphoesterase family protein